MSFFNPIQLRVLKTSWIPVALACSVMMITGYLLPGLLPENPEQSALLLASAVTFLMVTWEAVVKKDWKQLGIMTVVVIAAEYLLSLLLGAIVKQGIQNMLFVSYVNGFATVLVIVMTRFYLNGMGDKPGAALLAAVIYSVMPKTGDPLGFVRMPVDIHLSILQREVFHMAVNVLVTGCTFVSYYVIMFLTENSFRVPAFFAKLQSRLQTTGRWEYFFIFLSGWFAYMGATGEVNQVLAFFFEANLRPVSEIAVYILRMLLLMLLIYSCAGLIRNVIMGRMLSAGGYSPWTMILHYIPLLNIAGLASLFFSREKPASQVEHAVTYLEGNRKDAQYFMIAAGIFVTLYNIYCLLTEPTGFRLPVIGLLFGIYILKIFAYARLRAGKSYLYLVTVLNVITILFAINEFLLISLSFLFMYYYLLTELFYPQLEIEDTMQYPEPEQHDIFTHTA
ncbi:hypothetical protein [Chitinophaga tropicalis]|uniref:Uncharacterized protein n=1 Tax=Chitinophaga tropicalis TaxID=2683588 RepID=A0A7K1TXL1_9BACT|nr:hypothetical protein [Chitinophaga tropicalis]MVT06823.1 hypothetical protein [Chitinophaga tropicalis]